MPIHYIHPRLHSEYSLCDSLIRLPAKPEYGDPAKAPRPNLISRAVELQMPALALTDDSNLFALIKFYRAAEYAGIKPIAGCDLWVADPADPQRPHRLTVLCENHAGYLNLSRLISRAWREGQRGGRALIEQAWLEESNHGLLALVGRESEAGHLVLAGREDDAREQLDGLRRLFDQRLYLELARTKRDGEEAFNAQALQLAVSLDLPVIASNDVRFLDAEDFEAHEARVCVQQGQQLADSRRSHEYSPEQWLKPASMMEELFADIPSALENSIELAKRCNLELSFGKYYLPAFPVPAQHTLESWIRNAAREGLEARLLAHGPALEFSREDYAQRLDHELETIVRMGFAGYFLIVADFIGWAKRQGIPVGPGRGSGAGSLVAWSLGITDLDPLRFELLFERFLNPERVSMPDFDIDFCMEGRDRVIEYVADTYGRDQVSQIITYGTMAAKAVLRDCGRVLGMPYGQVDGIAKLIPKTPLDLTLEDALGRSPKSRAEPDRVVREFCDLYAGGEEARTLIDLALKLEGITRNAGKHAGGVVIAPSALTDFAPLYCEAGGGGVVTQFDKDDVEAVGLVKFDFLGLRTLTVIDWSVKAINAKRALDAQPPLDITALPLDDAPTYELLARGDTIAIFQFEGGGMQRLLKDAQPDRFEDLIALVSLFRPGPMDLIPSYVARKQGREVVDYPDSRAQPILKETYGIMVYQEQVMQMAQIVGGYSLGAADLLRRAMGKKKFEEMAKERVKFRSGAAASGLDERKADAIFDQMEKFAGYGFNKSHAAGYALVAYQTAWLKTHHRAKFMAATMSADMDNTDKVVHFLEDAHSSGLQILPPDVNASPYRFVALDPKTIRYGLGAIKGAGRAACEAIVAEREERGIFRDLADLCARVDPGKLNKRMLEALIHSGACDALASNRATLIAQLPEAVHAAEQHQRDRAAGQNDMFGMAASATVETPVIHIADQRAWPLERVLAGERATLGHYLSGHPTDPWRDLLSQLATCPLAEIAQRYQPPPPRRDSDDSHRFRRNQETPWTIAGVVTLQRRRGDSGAFVQFEDWSGRLEVSFFREVFSDYSHLLVKDAIMVVEGGLAFDDFSGELQLRARRAWTLDEACAAHTRIVRLAVNGIGPPFVDALKRVITSHRGGTTRLLLTGYRNANGCADMELGEEWRVHASTDLLRSLAELPGIHSVLPTLAHPSAAG